MRRWGLALTIRFVRGRFTAAGAGELSILREDPRTTAGTCDRELGASGGHRSSLPCSRAPPCRRFPTRMSCRKSQSSPRICIASSCRGSRKSGPSCHRSDTMRRLAYTSGRHVPRPQSFLWEKSRSSRTNNGNWSFPHSNCTRKVAPIIKAGTGRRQGETGESWRYPTGWQAVVRVSRRRTRRARRDSRLCRCSANSKTDVTKGRLGGARSTGRRRSDGRRK